MLIIILSIYNIVTMQHLANSQVFFTQFVQLGKKKSAATHVKSCSEEIVSPVNSLREALIWNDRRNENEKMWRLVAQAAPPRHQLQGGLVAGGRFLEINGAYG